MIDNQTIELLLREFVADACECKVRDCVISKYVKRIAAMMSNEWEEALEKLVQDVWAAYSAKAESSFHPAWEVDGELARRMAAFGFKVMNE